MNRWIIARDKTYEIGIEIELFTNIYIYIFSVQGGYNGIHYEDITFSISFISQWKVSKVPKKRGCTIGLEPLAATYIPPRVYHGYIFVYYSWWDVGSDSLCQQEKWFNLEKTIFPQLLTNRCPLLFSSPIRSNNCVIELGMDRNRNCPFVCKCTARNRGEIVLRNACERGFSKGDDTVIRVTRKTGGGSSIIEKLSSWIFLLLPREFLIFQLSKDCIQTLLTVAALTPRPRDDRS